MRCHCCTLGEMYSANSKLESHSLMQFSVYNVHCTGGRGGVSNSGTLASNRQNTTSPKYNDDISFLISHYLIFVCSHCVLRKERTRK
jgi:hypothetical protein